MAKRKRAPRVDTAISEKIKKSHEISEDQIKKNVSKYVQYSDTLTVNDDDPDLQPIVINLPKCPDIRTIEGFGLAPHNQIFRYTVIPRKLIELQKEKDTVEECYNEIRSNPEYYKEEIEFIHQEYRRRKEGYFFCLNGKPIWITGDHYFYLNYWFAGSKHPEYRGRDRKFFIFAWFCENDTACCGFNYPKFRREGATSKTSCMLYNRIAFERNVHGGIQSKDDESAARVFQKHVVQSWKKLPFFFKPLHEGKSEPKSTLNFFAPSSNVGAGGTSSGYKDSLESWIDYGSSTETYYDSDKLRFFYGDEAGKSSLIDVGLRHNVVKPTLMEGNRYIGIMVYTSTVGDMDKGGGEKFKKLCQGSDYHTKNENGETNTGLYNLFIPSYDGFDLVDKKTGERFIDRFGNSNLKRCREYLEKRRKALEEAGDMEGLSEEIRQYPFTFRECFRTGAAECNFNVHILDTRLDEFRFGNKFKVRGNFMWKDGFGSKVIWVPSKNGKFYASYIPPEDQTNRWVVEKGVRIPANKHLFIAGGDPFAFDKTKSNKKSDGAGAVFRKFDPSIDDPTKPVNEWKTNRFCCTYSNRPPTKDEYGEDMLMMCLFYGCEMFSEVNVQSLVDYFRNNGYGGYLYYQIKNGKFEKTPGASTNTKLQDHLYLEYYNYIERFGMNEVHDEILVQCRDIEDDMNAFDLFVAGGYALLGARRNEMQPLQVKNIPSFHRKRVYM